MTPERDGSPRPVLAHRRQGPVAVLSLGRPAARNALDTALVDALAAALDRIDADPGVRAAVLTGAPPGFCAGSDLRELAALPDRERVRHEARTGAVARALQTLRVPVVAAVEGFAIGGGFFLAVSCDLVVSARDSRWRLPEVELGWVPPWGLQALVARVGPAAAKRLAWGDRPVDATELHRLGAVDELTEPGRALGCALARAARLAALPPAGVVSTKAAFADAVAGPAAALDERAAGLFGADCRTPAARASLAGFGRRPGRAVPDAG